MFQIKCKCGHQAPIDEFTSTASGIELPLRAYQCRHCGTAWEIRQVEPPWVAPSGFVMPAKLDCVPIQPTL